MFSRFYHNLSKNCKTEADNCNSSTWISKYVHYLKQESKMQFWYFCRPLSEIGEVNKKTHFCNPHPQSKRQFSYNIHTSSSTAFK